MKKWTCSQANQQPTHLTYFFLVFVVGFMVSMDGRDAIYVCIAEMNINKGLYLDRVLLLDDKSLKCILHDLCRKKIFETF